ncbi:hypothetical protein L2E82_12047 [Cichorium intybus]|uniref:Uncharacterized protein n=1 Tax=Cichorium intybus TaxID=13427 RepID=A0ACB9GFN0_CICIN|nr:hypothetical protein L2E82_12047 [Cichorium intybus]
MMFHSVGTPVNRSAGKASLLPLVMGISAESASYRNYTFNLVTPVQVQKLEDILYDEKRKDGCWLKCGR